MAGSVHPRFMRQGIRLACIAVVFRLAALGQTPSESGRIEGSVVNAVTGQPVRKVRLSLTPAKGGEPVTAATDAQGKYVLPNVPSGSYKLYATHDGYLPQRYGSRKPGEDEKGDLLDVTSGLVKTKVDLQMTPLGVILGHIRDENGDPVRQVEVAVMAYGYGPTGKLLQIRSTSLTDASGEYRAFDLPPGKYYVRARPLAAQMPGTVTPGESYPMVYYPNALQPTEATAIDIAAGQEHRGMDFLLRPVAVAFIRGRIIKPAGGENCLAALEGADGVEAGDGSFSFGAMSGSIGAVYRDIHVFSTAGPSEQVNLDELFFPGSRKVNQNGKFEFRNIPVGNHSLTASCTVDKQHYRIKTPILLPEAGLENLELRPVGPSSLTGQVQVEGESKSKIADTHVSLEERGNGMVVDGQTAPDIPEGTVAENGAFTFHYLAPRLYHLNVEPPADLYVKSVTWSGRDIRDSGVDLSAGGMSVEVQVVLSASGGTIEGSVENGEGAKVTLIPADPELVRTLAKSTDADEAGHFSFAAMPPGRYKLFAWEGVDVAQALYDAEFRKPFEDQGQTVELAEKAKVTAQLKVIAK
jgi:hypothetical protein